MDVGLLPGSSSYNGELIPLEEPYLEPVVLDRVEQQLQPNELRIYFRFPGDKRNW